MSNISLIHGIMGKSFMKLPIFPRSLLPFFLAFVLFDFFLLIFLFDFYEHFHQDFFRWFSQLNQIQNACIFCYSTACYSHSVYVVSTCHVAFVAYSSEKLCGISAQCKHPATTSPNKIQSIEEKKII